MFKKVTQSIVNQMDPRGDLVPVCSILDHEDFRPLCLVKRKKPTTFHPSPRYRRTGYTLDDMLLPGDDKSTESLFPHGGGQDSSQYTIKKSTCDSVDGNLDVFINSANVELKGAASLSQEWSIKLEKSHIPLPKFEALKSERKINVNHSFIKQLKKTQENLYVVHEIIKTSEEASYEEFTKAEGSLVTQLFTHLFAKFCAKRKNKQSIIIPKSCTLAFRAIQLDITDGLWDLYYFPEQSRSMLVSDGFSQGRLGALEEEIKDNCQILFMLSSNLLVIFLKAITAVMRDRNLFEELTQKMEAVLDEADSCELKTESPDLKDLLSSLQHSPRHLLLKLAEAITYALDALDELTEYQLLLLLESLEKKIVSQQLKLVKSILEHDAGRGNGHFSIDASLLSSQEEEKNITIEMIEISGVKLQEDGSAVWTREAFSAVAALYVSLYILNLLSNSR